MSTEDLSNRIKNISDSNRTTQDLIQRLANITFQPGSVPLGSQTNDDEDGDEEQANDARLELTAEIRDGLRAQEEDFELVKDELDFLGTGYATAHGRRKATDREQDQTRLSARAAKLGEDLKNSRAYFRKAQLQAKNNVEFAKQQERKILFEQLRTETPSSFNEDDDNEQPDITTSGPPLTTAQQRQRLLKQHGRHHHHQHDDPAVDSAGDVTSALRRMHDLMTTELSRSRFVQETLDESSAALAELSEQYSGLDTLLASSRNLLGSLLRSQKSDTWYLETAFWILVTTIVWLAFRRLLYGPLWWVVWLPAKLLYRVVFAVFGAVGLSSGGATNAVGASSSAGSSRTPLVVQPSATGKATGRFKMGGGGGKGVPVGAGGGGAKQGKKGAEAESVSEQVGQMVEESRQEAEQKERGSGGVRRGDGTLLEESDEPRNPKKRMMEGEGGSQTQARKRDEL